MRAITAIARSGAAGAALGLLAWPVAAEITINLDGEGSLLLARPCASLSQAKDMPDPIALFNPALPEGRRSAAKAALQRNRTGDDFSTWCRDAGAFPSPKNDLGYLKRDGELPKMTPLQNFDPAALWRDTLVEEMHCPS